MDKVIEIATNMPEYHELLALHGLGELPGARRRCCEPDSFFLNRMNRLCIGGSLFTKRLFGLGPDKAPTQA
jgi:hypothetical protein